MPADSREKTAGPLEVRDGFVFRDDAPTAAEMPELLEHGPADLDGEVTEFDPPRVLAYTWGDEHLRWELEPLPDGCRLALAHTFDERSGIPHPAGVLRRAARDASGWEVCLDSLEGILKGRQGEPGEQWQPLYERYVGKFSR